MLSERGREEVREFDFVVVGGGLAGLCTAIAAARHGAKAALVQDRPVLGGNSSSEIRVGPLGSASFNSWTRETGILDELLIEERSRNHDGVYDGMASSHYDLVLFEAAKSEDNLELFFNTSIREVETEEAGGSLRITGVKGSQLASEKEFVFKARQFADCTGDATVGFLAGAEFRYGREARGEFGENLAPVRADEQTMGSTLTMRARDIGRPVEFKAPEWAMKYRSQEDIGLWRKPGRFDGKTYGGYWWIEIGTPYHQIDDNQVIRDELLKHVLGIWDYIKNHSDQKETARNYALEWVGMVPGKRESRRLSGDVTITEHHCHHDEQWPDRVCYSGWFIDLHIMGGILNKAEAGENAHQDENYRYWVRIAPFSLPLRAFYSRNVENLWMAGRDISVTHCALGSTRVMMTHSLQGQAVGTAAAYALSNGITPRQAADPEGEHIRPIQQQLLRDDCNCFDLPNEDPEDLARGAEVSATSEAVLDFGGPKDGAWTPLSIPRAQVFPAATEKIESVRAYLKNESGQPVKVTARLEALERIWDREHGEELGKVEADAAAGFEGWAEFTFDATAEPGRPCRFILEPAEGVSAAIAQNIPTGTVRQSLHRAEGGALPKSRNMPSLQIDEIDLPPYEHWFQERKSPLTIEVRPEQKVYGPGSVNNGVAWPLSMPNLWVSDPSKPLPQSIELDFGEEKTLNSVQVSFDTNLLLTYHDMPGLWKPATCVRDWRLWARVEGEWKQVFEEEGNCMRLRRAKFEPVTASALKLEVLATNRVEGKDAPEGDPWGGGDSARIYEVRVYNE